MPVANDEMVEEVDAHGFASLLHTLREPVIVGAWRRVVGRMVVAESQDGSISQDRLPHDDADVHGSFRNTPVGDALRLDKLVVLVHEDNPSFFNVEVSHERSHVFIDGYGRTQVLLLHGSAYLPSSPQFDGSHNPASGHNTDAVDIRQLPASSLGETSEIVIILFEKSIAEFNSSSLGSTAADDDGKQFAIG